MYFAKPSTASRDPLNAPGASGVSTSAITAMWISDGETPTSVASVAGLVAAPAPLAPAAARAPSSSPRTMEPAPIDLATPRRRDTPFLPPWRPVRRHGTLSPTEYVHDYHKFGDAAMAGGRAAGRPTAETVQEA